MLTAILILCSKLHVFVTCHQLQFKLCTCIGSQWFPNCQQKFKFQIQSRVTDRLSTMYKVVNCEQFHDQFEIACLDSYQFMKV